MFATNWADWPTLSESGPITWILAIWLGVVGGSSPHAPQRQTAAIVKKR
jgi:hypothetical protein